jgi:mRNA-degrading endonuclease RelE of RelBE toxin-antitoxin system
MDLIFIEIPEFIKKFDQVASQEEMDDLQDDLLKNPFKGDLIKGTGGARKIRLKVKGKGKRGGARVIYYFVDLRGEIWFLDIYLKSKTGDISKKMKNKLYRFIKETING